ncbi:LysR family transcriptional regulator [Seohaeicola zhoushanensis]|uniref:LysR family transcriptional regulator n=1 Tax=Seohaeicola zhoushanensis TaxID=1569283 RepID=A0A8J3GYB5_9RHOB|nr:LysR family transcriptional regulator [Seohaeicola zhoushanensis]GHF57394.1 LysR family transcriptional regulator [Seohaeicola zhoushanensis]
MNLSGFDLNLLRVLDALLAEGSTVRAGTRIGLSQPAVSAALGRLRHALGDPLFVRQGQRLVPTDYARDLAQPLRDSLDAIEVLLDGPARFDAATASETFKISGSDFFAEMLMPALGERLSRIAPGVRVQLVDLVPDNYVRSLENREVDVALMPKPELPGWVEWQPLFHSDFVMVARRGHARLGRAGVNPGATVPIDLFCDLGHILFSPEGRLSAMGDAALAAVGRSRRVVMTMPVFFGVARAVAESDHVALLPGQLAARLAEPLGLDIYRPPMPVPTPQIGMVWQKRMTSTPGHRWLRDEIARLMEPLDTPAPHVAHRDGPQGKEPT